MFAKSIILAACAAALFLAGCGPSTEEIAKQNAQVASLRQSLEKMRDCTVELIQLKKSDNSGGTLKLEVDVERANKLLAQPADAKQIPALESAMKELNGAAEALQAEVDKVADGLHKANDAVRKAFEK